MRVQPSREAKSSQTITRSHTLPLALTVLVFVLLGLASQVRDTQAVLASYALDGTAPFVWTDISGTGMRLTGVSNADDYYQSDVPIGFTFSFAGTDYTVLEPNTNAAISLDQEGNDEFSNTSLPTIAWAGAALFPFWVDLSPQVAGDVYVQTLHTAPNRIFIIQYNAVTSFDSQDPLYVVTFQVALCEGSNNIVFQYLDAVFGDSAATSQDNGGSATVGIQMSSSSALQYSFNSAVITNGLAIVFYPKGGSATNCLATPTPTPTSTPTNTPTPTPTNTPTPTPISLGFQVVKDFIDNSTADVTVVLTCTSGTVTVVDVTASEADPADFSVVDPAAGTTCTATEIVPAGYLADEAACANVLLTAGTCTITNTWQAPLGWGDLDCNGTPEVRDGQYLMSSLLGSPISQTEPCLDLGGV